MLAEDEGVDANAVRGAVDQMELLRRVINEAAIRLVRIEGRQRFDEQGNEIDQDGDDQRREGEAMAAEAQPHQPRFGRGGVARGLRQGCAGGDVAHWKRILGSSKASNMSETSVPSTVSEQSSSRKAPARY